MELKQLKPNLKDLFKSPESRFMLMVGLKVMSFSLLIHAFVFYFLIYHFRLNYLFFKTQSKLSVLELETFMGYIFAEAVEILPGVFFFHGLLFLLGCYVGWLLLRPFYTLAKYSEEAITNINAVYHPEVYSNYNLLTRFSEFFFVYLRDCRIAKKLAPHSIPPQFTKIHRPTRDIVYFIHFSFLLLIIGLITIFFAAYVIDSLLQLNLNLALDYVNNIKKHENFFLGQRAVVDDIYALIAVLTVFLYGGLAFHLYDKMSGAAFGIFSTMKSFMKGNYSSRVHLLGYNHVRDYTRKINQFLNHVERELEKD